MPRAFLFGLLLLLAPADDAWASHTPDPGDGAWAAQNNEWLPPLADKLAPLPLAPAHGGAVSGAPRAALPAPDSPAPPRPDPLYLLMSLQR
jgi:hypothetical protein